jgi:hypothetical protein
MFIEFAQFILGKFLFYCEKLQTLKQIHITICKSGWGQNLNVLRTSYICSGYIEFLKKIFLYCEKWIMWFQSYIILTSTQSCSCRWVETMSLNCGQQWAYSLSPRWYMSMESHGGMILTGENRRTRRKTCPSATFSTTNPTWTSQGANPGLCGEMLATNCLSHDTAYSNITSVTFISEFRPDGNLETRA